MDTITTPEPVHQFISFFKSLSDEKMILLDKIYSRDVYFEDPFREIQGIDMLKEYFQKLNNSLTEGNFHFEQGNITDNFAYLPWIAELKIKRISKRISVKGISMIKYDDKIFFQRDYFDGGAIFYEHVPLLGPVIKMLKRNF